jgi:hypothetical protein
MRILIAEHEGRKYTLVATPLSVSGAEGTYHDGAERSLPILFRGFDIEPAASGIAGGFPYRDFLARQGSQTKLHRIMLGAGFVYTLTIEGADLAFADEHARKFFDGFEQRPATK